MSVDDLRLGAYRVTGSDWRSLYLRERAARIDCEVRLRDAAAIVVAPAAAAVDWRAAWERERDARLDAEARLSGQRAVMVSVVVAVVALAMLMGCLSGCNDASRAVARWEVSDG
jgi:hypothetical protein